MDTLSLQLLEPVREGRSRMAIALLLSLALHGLVLSLRGGLTADQAPSPPLEITLVNSLSAEAPLRPQALAQQNLNGGGDAQQGMVTSPLPRTDDSQADEVVLAALHRRQAALEAEQKRLLTQLEESQDQVAQARPLPQLLGQSRTPGDEDRDQESVVLSARIAALKARIEHYNALPRQTYVAPATQANIVAQYVEAWRKRIELIGTEHYPAQARGKIYGELQLTVYIRRDGQVDHIQFDKPSQHAILNSAARRIVELAAPFDPLPPALAHTTDTLAITRTWHFTRTGVDTASP